MIQLFDGETWFDLEGALSLSSLKAARRARVRGAEIYTPVRISEDLIDEAKGLKDFVPKDFYMFSEVAAEREIGRAQVFVISTMEPA